VWLLVVTFCVAVVMVVVTFGSVVELARLQFTAAWLLAAGLIVQVALELVDFPHDQIETIGFGLLMASYGFILAFCLTNLSIRGLGVIAVGVAMNAIVIGLNQGMPTVAIGNDANGNRIQKRVEQTVKHRPESNDDLLSVLDDQIILPKPLDSVVSFGDLVISVGICELVYFGTRRRRRRRGRPQTGVARTPRAASTRSSAARTPPS
jgi:hypothetical protein